ncbi:hypothetical protein GMORB2_5206 [Geosmithia morbida]|uniref:Uncharacterized protein n=1 Tax=Geosmithia morbida TaxID=1094350 RepID=A0A9P4YYU8_9HYPO|nr:uncharacterized protein GMORB2_5206 [Geosmithia morbida]KAF4124540.1 hypothetical protein GMORB2_5206 [Geosmithia morbida]
MGHRPGRSSGELEIVNQPLIDARDAVLEEKAKAVPVGKKVDDLIYPLSEIRRRDRGEGSETTNRIDQRAVGLKKEAAESEAIGSRRTIARLKADVTAAEESTWASSFPSAS